MDDGECSALDGTEDVQLREHHQEDCPCIPTCSSSRKEDLSLAMSSLVDAEDSSCGLALMGERDGRPAAGVAACTSLLTGTCSPLFRLTKRNSSDLFISGRVLIKHLDEVSEGAKVT